MARVLMVAGEASADRHAAGVVRSLKAMLPDVEVFGLGGPRMEDAGMQCIYSMADLSVMGFTDVIYKIFSIIRIYSGLKGIIRDNKVDIFVPVDLPDFNMRLAAYAKRNGAKVLYYIAPQAWAWRANRARVLSRITDGLAVIFPFEEPFFRSSGVDARYVGHPLLGQDFEPSNASWPPKKIAMLPGSRKHEIKKILPIMMSAKRRLDSDHPNISWFLYASEGIGDSVFRRYTGMEVQICRSLPEVDAAFVKSGTGAFEIAMQGIPGVICYKTSFINYALARAFVKTSSIGMPNIIAGYRVVPELIQGKLTGKNLAQAMGRFIDDEDLYKDTRSRLIELRSKMGSKNASEEVARWIISMLSA